MELRDKIFHAVAEGPDVIGSANWDALGDEIVNRFGDASISEVAEHLQVSVQNLQEVLSPVRRRENNPFLPVIEYL